MATQDEPNILIPFYQGTGGDHQDRKLDEILSWPDQLLEDCHDYIQTLFPLPEASRFAWSATLVDRHVFEAFRARPELRAGLRRSFNRMLSFYGLEAITQDGNMVIRRADNFPVRSQNWVARVDHNHLRITRIIRSLRILGLEKEAEAFFEILSDIYMNSSDRCRPCKESMKYWTRAAKRPLNFAPNVNDTVDPEEGEEFLWKYEMAKASGENNGIAETSLLSNATDESDGGVLLPRDDDEGIDLDENGAESSEEHRPAMKDEDVKTIRELMKEKAKFTENESDVFKASVPETGSSRARGRSPGNTPPSLKRKTKDEAEERTKKAMK